MDSTYFESQESCQKREAERGKYILIWSNALISLLGTPPEIFTKACRNFFTWYLTGETANEDDFTNHVVRGLIADQMRSVEKWHEKSAQGKSGANKRWHSNECDSMQSHKESSSGNAGCANASKQMQSKSIPTSKTTSDHHQSIPHSDSKTASIPTLDETLEYGKSHGMAPKGVKTIYAKLAAQGWSTAGKPILHPFSFIETCYKNLAKDDPAEVEMSAFDRDEITRRRLSSKFD